MKLTYSVLPTSRASVEVCMFSDAGPEFKKSFPNSYVVPAKEHAGYLIMACGYVFGYGLTVDEAYADALYVHTNDLLTHDRLMEVIQ